MGPMTVRFLKKADGMTVVSYHRADGTATWSLTTLQRALHRAPDGLPRVSTYVIFHTLHRAGYTSQQDRTWCRTGTVQRKRKEGLVEVTDPATDEKRGTSSRRTP